MALVRTPQCSSNSDAEAEDEESGKHEKSECFFAGKDTALVLALKDIPPNIERRLSTDSTRSTNSTQSNNSDIQQHLQSMFYLLTNEETLKMAVKLESNRPNRTRYLVIASRCCYRASTTERKYKITRNNSAKTATASATILCQLSVDSNSNRLQQQQQQLQQQQSQTESNENVLVDPQQKSVMSLSACSNRESDKCDADKCSASGDNKSPEGVEESCLLGIDCNERTTIGLVVPILADTTIHLDGDGGFSVSVNEKTHIFKPVSVQAMWSALQTLHKFSQKAYKNNFYPGGPSHDWLSFYEQRIESDQSCLNEWNAMDSLESRRPPSPDAIRNKPTAKEETESVIKMKLKEIMMSVDLDEVTSKYIRWRLEELLDMDLGEYKSFIDKEMLTILGQMDAPTEIFEHVYLGSEWNANNLEELQKNGVRHILNVTREIDNFFPGTFDYFNVRVYDDEKTNLLKHWDKTYRYITRAKAEGSKVLVHCKMGVSRSASVVIAYAMKAYNWELDQALQHVKDRRSCIKPNKNFLNQLETYRGMLDAMKNKEKLQHSKSETNLKSTKDPRLLPGSEPTPFIQAHNQSKSVAAGHRVPGDDGTASTSRFSCSGKRSGIGSTSSTGDQKHRRTIRRSSSTSPKSIQSYTAIVIKQQSQSLENLTPERSIADEPKNVRYPGSNGENYSVTQNQVLHIQKNTPPPTSVRTMVHEMEAFKNARKTVDDRKLLNLQFGRSMSQDTNGRQDECVENAANIAKSQGSPVWTSSAKLITQSSNLDSETAPQVLRASIDAGNACSGDNAATIYRRESKVGSVLCGEGEKRRSRKTQSWAATSGSGGGIVMDAPTNTLIGESSAIAKLGSSSSLESASSSATLASSEGFELRTRPRQRELPSRHASWGSGDTRSCVPMRNSSWGPYDTNCNATVHCFRKSTAATAIFEGKIHETRTSNKTASSCHHHHYHQQYYHHHQQNRSEDDDPHQGLGTVKRTKQKLEACTALKKLCQENGAATGATPEVVTFAPKRSSNLHRSASATGGTRTRFPNRCNSEEIVPSHAAGVLPRMPIGRHSDGCRSVHTIPPFSASAPDTYTISDFENKNMLSQQDVDEDSAAVVMRGTLQSAAIGEQQRISGNVQILKKSFEAKAGGTNSGGQTQTQSQTQTLATSSSSKKGHSSLPSSPVAQHVDHHSDSQSASATTEQIENLTANPTSASSSSTSSSSSSSTSSSSASSTSSVSESSDRNVKNMIHKYQTTNTVTTTSFAVSSTPAFAPNTTTTITTASNVTNFKTRPRSFNEHHHTLKSVTGKPHDYSENRPPPAPVKSLSLSSASSIATTAASTTTTTTTTTNTITTTTTTTTTNTTITSAAITTTNLASMTDSSLVQQEKQPQNQPQQQQQQHRRIQPINKTPHSRLFPQQNMNATAYNTM